MLSYQLPTEGAKSGTTVDSIDSERLKTVTVKVAPSPEQRRIVAKLDSLFARTKAARDELARIPLLIEHYKQAILKKAFTGELTADWRRRKRRCKRELISTARALPLDLRIETYQYLNPFMNSFHRTLRVLLGVALLVPFAVQAQDLRPVRPDPKLTPGATFDVTLQDISTPGYSKTVRAVTSATRREVFRRYGITNAGLGDYEIDHLSRYLLADPTRSRTFGQSHIGQF